MEFDGWFGMEIFYFYVILFMKASIKIKIHIEYG